MHLPSACLPISLPFNSVSSCMYRFCHSCIAMTCTATSVLVYAFHLHLTIIVFFLSAALLFVFNLYAFHFLFVLCRFHIFSWENGHFHYRPLVLIYHYLLAPLVYIKQHATRLAVYRWTINRACPVLPAIRFDFSTSFPLPPPRRFYCLSCSTFWLYACYVPSEGNLILRPLPRLSPSHFIRYLPRSCTVCHVPLFHLRYRCSTPSFDSFGISFCTQCCRKWCPVVDPPNILTESTHTTQNKKALLNSLNLWLALKISKCQSPQTMV